MVSELNAYREKKNKIANKVKHHSVSEYLIKMIIILRCLIQGYSREILLKSLVVPERTIEAASYRLLSLTTAITVSVKNNNARHFSISYPNKKKIKTLIGTNSKAPLASANHHKI